MTIVSLAAVFLCAGSGFLLVGPVVWLTVGDPFYFDLRFQASFLHGLAWLFLSFSLFLVPWGWPRAVMAGAFLWSLVGFGIGWVTLPQAFPGYAGGYFCALEWEFFVCRYFFMYVPSLFGPVVACHAVFFPAVSRLGLGRTSSRMVLIGSAVLLGVGAIALAVQVSGHFGGADYLFAGFTAFGYAPIAFAFWRERTPTAVLSPGPAAPSRDPSP